MNTSIKILLAFILVGVLGITGYLVYRAVGLYQEAADNPQHYQQLLRDGQPATGTVTAIEDMNLTVNRNPGVRLHLHVVPKDSHIKPYQAVLSKIVSRVAIPRVGDRLNLKFNRANPVDLIWLKGGDR